MNQSKHSFDWFETLKAAMTYTQLGLSVVAPLILSVLLAFWLQRRFELDNWVTLVGLGVGLAAMILTLIRYIHSFIQEGKKRQEALRAYQEPTDKPSEE